MVMQATPHSLKVIMMPTLSLLAAPEIGTTTIPNVASDDKFGIMTTLAGIILCMHPANERRRYSVTPSLIGWVHTQNESRFSEIA